jgi:alpha-L-arabinofuranosidase
MNRIMHKSFVGILLGGLLTCTSLQSQNPAYLLKVDVKNVGSPIQPSMYGIFFEDINFGADGGLYAELVKNRSFEFTNALSGWIPFGDVSIETKDPCFERNPHYVRLTNRRLVTGTGLENEGFRGMGVKSGENYDFTVYARVVNKKNDPIKIRLEQINSANKIIETQKFEITGTKWTKYKVVLSPKETEPKAHLRITMESEGTIDLEHISLFPQKTFMNRPNGMREDLAQALKNLKPGVFRFPGGCIVEGTTIKTRYQWKNTVGPVENRPLNINRWNYTFPHKKFPDYYQSYGLGFYEYFLLSEDLGAEPLPVLNCGLSCQYENEGMDQHVCVKDLKPYVDDALDLIEFANGPITSTWGKVRAEMGHPEPFNLKYIAIGNEQWGEIYTERLNVFVDAIRAKYPKIKIVGGSGPGSEGKDFDYLWPEMKRLKVDLVDEHFYRSPEWFLRGAARYYSYDRNGPKDFAGEYACHPDNRENSFLTALCEAAFMTGFERNADVVQLATYAPLFAHVDAWQWRPDLIWFDNLNHVCTPNYYVQQLYSQNSGTHVLSLSMDGKPLTGQSDLFATASFDQRTNELILKIANVSILKKRISLSVNGMAEGKHTGVCTLLHSMDLEAKNTLEQPDQIVPRTVPVEMDNATLNATLLPFSFSVYRIAL